MILVDKCYQTVTHESAEQGDFSDQGYIFEDVRMTFDELWREMRWYSRASSSPSRSSDWLESEPDTDYRTGEETTYSLHYSRNNLSRSEKYWEKAMKKAGLLK